MLALVAFLLVGYVLMLKQPKLGANMRVTVISGLVVLRTATVALF